MREAMMSGGGGAMGSRSLLRRMNSLGILRQLTERAQTLRELVAESGLSRTAVDAVVADLAALGWVDVARPSSSGRLGRPAATYSLRSRLGYFLSLDIGANHISAVLTDLTRTTVQQGAAEVAEDLSAQRRIAAAMALAQDLLRHEGVGRDDVWAVCVGSPGVIDASGRVRHFGGEGMPGWVGLDIRARFAKEFSGLVLVEGDVALGARAEVAIGQARGHRDVVYILCGVRTSAAVVIGGRVRRGVHGAAGIVGELPELKWRELNERYGTSVLDEPRPSREQIFAQAREGDPASVTAVAEFAADLATGAAAMILAIDPELLVIGGGSAPGADVFLADFERLLAERCPEMPTVAVSSLGSEAVALGGIGLAADHVLDALERAVRTEQAFPDPRAIAALLRRGHE